MDTRKKWLYSALSLLGLGVIILLATLFFNRFSFSFFNTAKYDTKTYEATEDFRNISVTTAESDVVLVPSGNGTCRVECQEADWLRHTFEVRSGTLEIGETVTRNWLNQAFGFHTAPRMTVYLPKNAYTALLASLAAGDMEIPGDFSFESISVAGGTSDVVCAASAERAVDIALSTGNIDLTGISAGELILSVSTGDIRVTDAACRGDVSVGVSTGKAVLTDVTCRRLVSQGSTGDITLKNVMASESFDIVRGTGDVRFEGSDAASILVRTTTGEVSGTLLSDKVFVTDTSTGDVRVPKTSAGGRCEISTSTGDINIEIRQ